MDTFCSPCDPNPDTERYLIDYTLGLTSLPNSSSADADAFWARVKAHLLALPLSSPAPRTNLLLAGESASDSGFWKALIASIVDLRERAAQETGPSPPFFWGLRIETPIFAAARGAAAYARKRQTDTFGCREPKRCTETRRLEREGGGKAEL
jgi:hypothetical protein